MCSRRQSIVLPWLIAVISIVLLAGCSQEMTGPEADLEDPTPEADPLPLEPGIVCQDQLSTTVTITGDKFSPVPIDVLEDTRLALPTVSLQRGQTLTGEATDEAVVTYSGNPDDPINREFLSWQSQSQMQIEVNQSLEGATDGMLPAGIHDVSVQNPNDSEATSVGAIAVAPKPTLEAASPPIVCLTDGERTVSLSGDTFLEIEGQQATVDVSEQGEVQVADHEVGLTDCSAVAHEGISAQICGGADLTLAQDELEQGYYGLQVNNPETAACESTDDVKLRVVPPPSIDSIAPPMACVAQSDRTFVIEGADFLTIDGSTPTVTVAGNSYEPSVSGCSDLETQGVTVQSCSTMEITIPQGDVEPGRQEVIVENPQPAGCQNQAQAFVTITPPPAITEIDPALVCLDDGAREVIVRGTGFVTVDDGSGAVLPEVQFDGNVIDAANVSAQSCSDLEVDGLAAQTCTELAVTISETDVSGDQPSVTVTNPPPAGCSDTQEQLLTVVPGPEITGAEPPMTCTDDSDRSLVITGNNFLEIDGTETPTVRLDGTEVSVVDIRDCSTVTVSTGSAQSCQTLEVSVPSGTLAAGDVEVEVENPQPAGCFATDTEVLTVPPTLQVSNVEPGTVCAGSTGGSQILTVSGQGFLTVDDGSGVENFTVSINGSSVTPDSISGCSDLTVDGLTVESCDTFTVTIDTSGATVGDAWDLEITNPAPSGCSVTEAGAFTVSEPPTISSVAPSNICSGVADQVTITGTNFVPGTDVTFTDGTNVFSTTNGEVTTTLVSDTEITASIVNGLDAGTYDVTVSNGSACEDSLAASLAVDPEPVVFFVDPSVVYNGIRTRVSIYVTNVPDLSASDAVVAVDSSGNRVTLENPQRVASNRVQATVPANTLSAGDYEVEVTTQLGCSGGLPGAMSVTDDSTGIAVDGITPPFGWQGSPTSVNVTADEAAPADEHFDPVPRVYLNPTSAGGSTTATELQAVTFNSATELNGIVPKDLDLGRYDVIVVNPDGTVGILSDAYEVTAQKPPVLTSVEPGTWVKDTTVDIVIFGENFRYDSTTVPEPLTVTCDANGTTETPADVTFDSANSDGSVLSATVDTNGLSEYALCTLRITNPDGTFGELTPVVVTNPSNATNFFEFQAAPDLNVGRRGPAVVGGAASARQRFTYALGGDNGSLAGAMDSIEFTRIDRKGAPQGWEMMPRTSLPVPLTMSKAVQIADFVYLVGGYKAPAGGTAEPTGQIWRANILDPLDVPEISDVSVEIDSGNGLDTGTYYYRVSAVLTQGASHNPGGETLTSEPLPFRVPSAIAGDLVPTIVWDSFPDADEYRVYRSENPNDVFGTEKLITTVQDNGSSTFSFRDPNTTPGANADSPLPVGQLGTWHDASPTLGGIQPRHSHGLTVVQDPQTVGDYHVYAGGGQDGSGVLASVDSFTVEVTGPRSQAVSGVSNGAATLSAARTQLRLAVADRKTARVLNNPPILYAFGGADSVSGAPSFSRAVDAYPINNGGSLGTRFAAGADNEDFAGYAGGIFNGSAIVIGGFNGGVSDRARWAPLLADGTLDLTLGISPGEWATFSPRNVRPRFLAGAAPFLGFYYIVGGNDGTNTASTIVDFTIVGAASQ